MAANTTPTGLARQLLNILASDAERLEEIDDYLHGRHEWPYMPDNADAEYKLLAERCISNWMPLLVSTPAQALYVDSFRRGVTEDGQSHDAATSATAASATPEMEHWQRSRLDARQLSVHRAALGYGHSFVVTEKTPKGIVSRGLSALKTAALFEDPANDETPYAALSVTVWPRSSDDTKGEAWLWDGKRKYKVRFLGFGTADDLEVAVMDSVLHGARECPVTRFAAYIDLEGRTRGVVEPMIPLQDRINQTVFDLLVAQTGGSFKVRWATGMAPPVMQEPVDVDGNIVHDPERNAEQIAHWRVRLDAAGNPIPAPVNLNAKRFLFGEDESTKFGTLDETPLDGYISSIDMSIRHFSAMGQVPPHHLLGQIANLSADALKAAETSLLRMVQEFQQSFGESWERVFRLAAELSGDTVSADNFFGEVVWRDMDNASIAQSADALGKLAQGLDVPKRGLWSRIPGVTSNELATWNDLADQDPLNQLSDTLSRSTQPLGVVPPLNDDAVA